MAGLLLAAATILVRGLVRSDQAAGDSGLTPTLALATVLVLVAELVGRMLFYSSYWRIGV
jgi:DMSO reductase anchor subunit